MKTKDLNAVFLSQEERNFLTGSPLRSHRRGSESSETSSEGSSAVEEEEKTSAKPEESNESDDSKNSSSYLTSIEYEQEAAELLEKGASIPTEELQKRLIKLKDYSWGVKQIVMHANGFPMEETGIIPCVKKRILNNIYNIDDETDSESLNKRHANKITTKKEEKESVEPKSLRKLRISSFLILICIITYAILDFILNAKANNDILENFKLIGFVFDSLNEYIFSAYLIRSITLANNKNYTNYIGKGDYTTFQKKNMELLTKSKDNIQFIISNISASFLELSPEHKKLLYKKTVPFYYLDNQQNLRKSSLSLINSMSLVNYALKYR